ncbi:MAG: HigA family addiction module antitoxin [Spirochaetes bacterium]|jgi:addiction module HigA family antidote|nr:HigA family addiction module antitoxin [Spirochaetota bacterium]
MITSRKPTHPGIVLKEDIIKPLGLTITEAAVDLGVSRKALSELLNERVSLSPDMAVRIAKATKTTPESWLYMQSKLDLWISENKDLNVIPFPISKHEYEELKEN